MLRLISDEDVHDDIFRGLRRREPTLDIVRARDVGLDRTPDRIILEWAASQERILFTGDLNTMVGFAWARVQSPQPMPGVLALLENTGSSPFDRSRESIRACMPFCRERNRHKITSRFRNVENSRQGAKAQRKSRARE